MDTLLYYFWIRHCTSLKHHKSKVCLSTKHIFCFTFKQGIFELVKDWRIVSCRSSCQACTLLHSLGVGAVAGFTLKFVKVYVAFQGTPDTKELIQLEIQSNKVTRKHLCRSLCFSKFVGFQSLTLLKRDSGEDIFLPVNFKKLFKTSFLPLWISPVSVTRPVASWNFDHIYWRRS